MYQPNGPSRLFAPLAGLALTSLLACGGCSSKDDGTELPVITVFSPEAGEVMRSPGLELCALIADGDTAISSLIVRADLDGQRLYEKTPGDNNTLASTNCNTSNGDGNMGLTVEGIADGYHTLDINVTDPSGVVVSARVAFTVEGSSGVITPSPADLNPTPGEDDTPEQGAPTCQMLSPNPGAVYAQGQAITFEARAQDDDDPASELLVRWTSDPPSAVIGVQGGYASFASATRFTTTELEAGSWTVTAEVTDPAGGTGTCATQLVVQRCDDADEDGVASCGESADCDDDDPEVHPGHPDHTGAGDEDCDGEVDEDGAPPPGDGDADGYPEGADCDDADSATHPGANESPDGKDNDCDDKVDEHTWLYDDDGDSYAEADGDCDDTSPTTHPGAAEGAVEAGTVVADGRDNDCDGRVDEGTNVTDDDSDTYTEAGGDCDDHAPQTHPGAFDDPRDGADNDCDGRVDEGVLDLDGDGYPSAGGSGPTDCDDSAASVHPGAAEACDGIDADCDGEVDEGQPDADGDGATACQTARDGGDCDDSSDQIFPGAPEGDLAQGALEGDGLDNDCDAKVDEGTDLYDDDGDGYAEVSGSRPGGDCDDTDPGVHPGALDESGAGDEDCDGMTDEDEVKVGDLVITEVRRATYQEAGTNLQWFEVKNVSPTTIYLAGWFIEAVEGDPDYGPTTRRVATLSSDAPALAPGGYAVIGANPVANLNGGVVLHATYEDLVLGLGGSLTLRLGSAEALAVDTVKWDDGILYPIEEGASLNLSRSVETGDDAHIANDHPLSWCIPGSFYGRDLRGTPGTSNDPC